MKKTAFVALIVIIAACSSISIESKSRIDFDKDGYDYELEIDLDLGVVERRAAFVFDFFDQAENVESNIYQYQESMYSMVFLPLYQQFKGSYKKTIQFFKKEITSVKKILRRAKKAGVQKKSIIDRLAKRLKQLNIIFSFVRKRDSVMTSLWSSAYIDTQYGTLVQSHKKIAQGAGDIVEQNNTFERDLLFTSFQNISPKHRKYPTAYFMRKFLQKDINNSTKQYKKSLEKAQKSFAVELFEEKYHDLIKLQSSIEKMDFYIKEKKALSRHRRSLLFLLMAPTAAVVLFFSLFYLDILCERDLLMIAIHR